MKRLVAVIALSLVLVMGIPLLASANDDNMRSLGFSDVDRNAWYAEAVNYMEEHDIMSGYEGTDTFGVNDPMTRAQFAVMIWRYENPEKAAAYDKNTTSNTTGLSDVASKEWYTGAANWAVETGAITGVVTGGDALFEPNEPMTCEQMITILERMFATPAQLDHLPNGYNSFADANQVSSWASEAMRWAYNFGIIKGDGDNRLNPLQDVSRARVATIFYRTITEEIPKEYVVYECPYYTVSLPPALAQSLEFGGYRGGWGQAGPNLYLGYGMSFGRQGEPYFQTAFSVTVYSDSWGPQTSMPSKNLGPCSDLPGANVYVTVPTEDYAHFSSMEEREAFANNYAQYVTVK